MKILLYTDLYGSADGEQVEYDFPHRKVQFLLGYELDDLHENVEGSLSRMNEESHFYTKIQNAIGIFPLFSGF